MLFIRADGNAAIGAGHIMRCLSLADAFLENGVKPIFVTAGPDMEQLIQTRGYACLVLGSAYDHMEEELPLLLPLLGKERPDCIILDSYFVTPDYMRAVKALAPLVYIDDLNAFDYPANIVVNYNLYGGAMPYPPGKTYLFGPRYVPLRKQFQGLAPRVTKERVEQVLFSTGGTDQYHAALRCCEYLQNHPPGSDIVYHFVLGSMNPDTEQIKRISVETPCIVPHQYATDMCALMTRCDAAVSAAGTTLYELCACGLPAVTYILADNQITGAAAFEAAGIMPCAGDIRRDVRFPERIFSKLAGLSSGELRRKAARQAQTLVDGNGAARLAAEIRALLEENEKG